MREGRTGRAGGSDAASRSRARERARAARQYPSKCLSIQPAVKDLVNVDNSTREIGLLREIEASLGFPEMEMRRRGGEVRIVGVELPTVVGLPGRIEHQGMIDLEAGKVGDVHDGRTVALDGRHQ